MWLYVIGHCLEKMVASVCNFKLISWRNILLWLLSMVKQRKEFCQIGQNVVGSKCCWFIDSFATFIFFLSSLPFLQALSNVFLDIYNHAFPFHCVLCDSRVVSSSPRKFFKKLDENSSNLCTWVGELYLELHQGTFTVQAKVSIVHRCNIWWNT